MNGVCRCGRRSTEFLWCAFPPLQKPEFDPAMEILGVVIVVIFLVVVPGRALSKVWREYGEGTNIEPYKDIIRGYSVQNFMAFFYLSQCSSYPRGAGFTSV